MRSRKVLVMVALIQNSRLRQSSERSGSGPLLIPGEVVEYSTSARLLVNDAAFAAGAVYVTNQRVVLVPGDAAAPVTWFEYRAMVMHAVACAGDAKYIFVQLQEDEDFAEEEALIEGLDGSIAVQETVLKIIPDHEDAVAELFSAINAMSALNPDVEDEQLEEVMDDEW